MTTPRTNGPGATVDAVSGVDVPVERNPDLVLARLHLRLGSLGLARAELEGMAGGGALDDEGLVDLAEARWRTGDLPGAGEAANVALASGSEAIVAYVIAAEATAAGGRPAEARRLASRALELSHLTVSDVFAGMPRASVWPIEVGATPATDATLFDDLAGTPTRPGPVAVGPGIGAGPGHGTPGTSSEPPGLWDDDADLGAALPDPAAALDAGRAALGADDRVAAALHLSLALRVAPSLAPAVLSLLVAVEGPELALVRGDALRIVGHERDARLAFATVAAAIPDRDLPAEPTDKETS